MSIVNSTLDPQSPEERLRRLLSEDASGHHRRWCERFLARWRQGTDQDLYDAAHLIRRVLESLPSDVPTTLSNGPTPRDTTAKTQPSRVQTHAVLGCRSLGLRILAAWVSGAPPTADRLFQGTLSLSALIEGSSVWRAKTLQYWPASESIEIVRLASRLLYEGLYGEWRPGWKSVPLGHDDLLAAANELVGVLEGRFSLEGRLVVHTVGPFDSGLQECDGSGPVPTLVMPMTFGIRAGPPDEQARRVLVREWNQEAVEQR